VVTIINSLKTISIIYTDPKGNSIVYKKMDHVTSPVITAGELNDKVFIVQIEGRDKPGAPGKLKASLY
jgi:hypothetical protein